MTTDSAPTGKRREHLARLEQVAREWSEPPIDAPEHTYWVALQVVIELLDEERRRVSPAQEPLVCAKVPHVGTGHLHGADDDTPFDVDGVKYCGRCHLAMCGHQPWAGHPASPRVSQEKQASGALLEAQMWLRQYGIHRPSCDKAGDTGECDCGLDRAAGRR